MALVTCGVFSAAMTSLPLVVEDPAPQQLQEERVGDQQRRKRRSYDVAFKMEVVAYAQEHNKMKAARQFDIHRRCVQTWCKTKDKLEAANNAKRMRLAEPPLAPAETLEVSISGITEDGEIVAALPVTCASVINSDVTELGAAALALALVNTYQLYKTTAFFMFPFRRMILLPILWLWVAGIAP